MLALELSCNSVCGPLTKRLENLAVRWRVSCVTNFVPSAVNDLKLTPSIISRLCMTCCASAWTLLAAPMTSTDDRSPARKCRYCMFTPCAHNQLIFSRGMIAICCFVEQLRCFGAWKSRGGGVNCPFAPHWFALNQVERSLLFRCDIFQCVDIFVNETNFWAENPARRGGAQQDKGDSARPALLPVRLETRPGSGPGHLPRRRFFEVRQTTGTFRSTPWSWWRSNELVRYREFATCSGLATQLTVCLYGAT